MYACGSRNVLEYRRLQTSKALANVFYSPGVPMAVVIIVIAIDKDNYGLISYGKFDDGTTDEL